LWFGLTFMVMVMFKPEGLAGIWQDGQAMLGRRKAAVEPCPEPNHAGGD
jgi:branched-chain amino acid transport system permease protein